MWSKICSFNLKDICSTSMDSKMDPCPSEVNLGHNGNERYQYELCELRMSELRISYKFH